MSVTTAAGTIIFAQILAHAPGVFVSFMFVVPFNKVSYLMDASDVLTLTGEPIRVWPVGQLAWAAKNPGTSRGGPEHIRGIRRVDVFRTHVWV